MNCLLVYYVLILIMHEFVLYLNTKKIYILNYAGHKINELVMNIYIYIYMLHINICIPIYINFSDIIQNKIYIHKIIVTKKEIKY